LHAWDDKCSLLCGCGTCIGSSRWLCAHEGEGDGSTVTRWVGDDGLEMSELGGTVRHHDEWSQVQFLCPFFYGRGAQSIPQELVHCWENKKTGHLGYDDVMVVIIF